jgi:hypothetical protein
LFNLQPNPNLVSFYFSIDVADPRGMKLGAPPGRPLGTASLFLRLGWDCARLAISLCFVELAILFLFSRPPASPTHGAMKLGSTVPPLTCQLAIPASAGANSPHLHEQPVLAWIVQLAEESESCFFLGHDFSRALTQWQTTEALIHSFTLP